MHLGTEPGAARLALDCDDFEWLGPREPGIKTSTPITAPTAAITNTTAPATALRLRRHRRASLKRTSGDGGPTACAGRVIVGDLAIAQRTVSIIAMTSLLRYRSRHAERPRSSTSATSAVSRVRPPRKSCVRDGTRAGPLPGASEARRAPYSWLRRSRRGPWRAVGRRRDEPHPQRSPVGSQLPPVRQEGGDHRGSHSIVPIVLGPYAQAKTGVRVDPYGAFYASQSPIEVPA